MDVIDNLTYVVSTSWLEYIRVKCLQSVCQENRCANIDYLLKTAGLISMLGGLSIGSAMHFTTGRMYTFFPPLKMEPLVAACKSTAILW